MKVFLQGTNTRCFTRILFFIIFTALFWLTLPAQSVDKGISAYKNTPLEDILNDWQAREDISFSYDYDLIKKYTLSGNFSNLSIKERLIKALRFSDLEFELISGNNYIIKKKSGDFYTPFKYKICGTVIDSKTLKPLPFANIQLKDTDIGMLTDSNGYFSIQAPFVSNDTILIGFIGYKNKFINVGKFKNRPCQKIELNMYSTKLNEIIIRDRFFNDVENNTFLSTENVSSTSFYIKDIEDIGSFAEKDVLQIAQLLPSVSSTDESASKIHIRGGNSGQTLVLYDDITLYHQGHFFGKISSINPNAVEKVNISKEGYSSSYGSRVSGVVDIKGKQKIPLSTSLKIEGSLLSGNINLELPLFDNKFAAFVNYRRSFTDFYHPLAFVNNFDQIFQNSIITSDKDYIKKNGLDTLVTTTSKTSFYDLNTKFVWQPDQNDKVIFTYLITTDFLKYSYDQDEAIFEESILKIKNNGLNTNWKHKWNKSINSKIGFSMSGYENFYQFKDHQSIDSASLLNKNNNSLKDYSFELSNNILKEDQYFSIGYQLNTINEKAAVFKRDGNFPEKILNDSINGVTNTIFTDYRLDLDRIDFNFGMRLNHYNLTKKLYFEPRFLVKVYPFKNFSYKLAGGIYYQMINQIVEINNFNAEDNLWILSRNSEKRDLFSTVKNTQYSMGIAFKLLSWNFDFTYFDRFYKGITSRTLRFDTKDFPFYSGNMSSSGLEIGIQKRTKYYYTIIGYSWKEVKYEFDYPEYPVAASYNKKHSLDILQGVEYNGFMLSATFKYGTGMPYTPVDSIGADYSDPENPGFWIEYKSFNSNFLSPYYRVDLALSKKFQFKNFYGKLKLSVLNVFNHKNHLQRYYRLDYINDTDKPSLIESDRFGLPLTPNIGLILSLGKR